MDTKICKNCGNVFPISDFGKEGTYAYYRCKQCMKEYQNSTSRRFRQRHPGYNKEYNTEYFRTYNKNPEVAKRKNARNKVSIALINGTLVKPLICSKCGIGSKLEAHHDDYSKPLEVVWLCKKCHITRRYYNGTTK